MAKREYEVVVENKIIDIYTFIVEAQSAEHAEYLAAELVRSKRVGSSDIHSDSIFVKQVWSAEQGYERQKR